MTKKEDKDIFESLRWIRIFDPIHIPKRLVKQIKQREYDVDEFFDYQKSICLIPGDGVPVVNPLNHLYVIANEDNEVVGFLWFVVDELTKNIFVQNFSVDASLWNKGKAIEFASKHVKQIKKKAKLKKIYWVTNHPKVFEKHGFELSKDRIMECEE